MKFKFSPSKLHIILHLLISGAVYSYAQNNDTAVFKFSVTLDSLVIRDVDEGFNVEDFVELVKTDTTFYRAFRNLRFTPHTIQSNLTFYDKRSNKAATYKAMAMQSNWGDCRIMKVEDIETTGNYIKKNGSLKYITAKMYEKLFYTYDTICEKNLPVNKKNLEGIDNQVEQLKTLIFSPGTEVDGVPLVKKKMAIFDDDMHKYYDYNINSTNFNGIDCYSFNVKRKLDYKPGKANKTVFNELITYFNKDNFSIVGRYYDLSFKSSLFGLDVKMNVETTEVNQNLVPKKITYMGYWNIPSKKPEIANIKLNFKY